MADTERSVSALQSRLADNTTGAVSPQDVRDALVSLVAPRGSMYIADGDTAETSITVQDTWTKVAGTTTAGASETAQNISMTDDNELTYTDTDGSATLPTRDFWVASNISLQAASNNTSFEFALAKNGTVVDATHVDIAVSNANTLEGLTVNGIIQLDDGDTLGLYVKNTTDTSNVTVQTLVLSAFGFLD